MDGFKQLSLALATAGLLASGVVQAADPPLPNLPTTLPKLEGKLAGAKAYESSKKFTFSGMTVTNMKSASIESYAHAYAYSERTDALDFDHAVDPANQDRSKPPPFSPYGVDTWLLPPGKPTSVPVGNNGAPVNVKSEPFMKAGVINAGPGSSATGKAHAGPVTALGSIAESDAWGYAVRGSGGAGLGRSDTIYGTLSVWGYAKADRDPKVIEAEAYASSYAGLRVNGQLVAGLFGTAGQDNNEGEITSTGDVKEYWMPDPKRYGSKLVYIKDPLSFTITDPITEEALFSDWLFESDVSILASDMPTPGSIKWGASGMLIDAADAMLSVKLNGAYTIQQGELRLLINHGVVVDSFDSGVFDGWLPDLGATGPVMISSFGNDFSFDYDLSSLASRFSADANLTLEASSVMGSAFDVAAVPEPSTYVLMLGGLGLLALATRRRATQSTA